MEGRWVETEMVRSELIAELVKRSGKYPLELFRSEPTKTDDDCSEDRDAVRKWLGVAANNAGKELLHLGF